MKNYPSRNPPTYNRKHWRWSSKHPTQPVCVCGKGYGSKYDGLCQECRGMSAYEAQNPPKPDTRGHSVRAMW